MFSALRRASQFSPVRPLKRASFATSRCYATAGEDENSEKDERYQLPMLQRPLGVKERPSTFVKTWGEKQMELIDPEKRRAQRDHLIKEVGKGYFADLNRTRKFGGKTWIAPPTAIREDKALYFPDIVGTPLDKNTKVHTTDLLRGKISVVGILTTQISDEHIRYFVQSTNAAFLNPQYPRYQHVLINLQENVLKSMLVSIFLSSIRRSVPPEMHSRYLASSQNMEFVREDMGMVNKHIGYVYLVDENLKIRWAGCGDAKAEESEALLRCTKVLLERLQQKVPEKGEKNVKGAVK